MNRMGAVRACVLVMALGLSPAMAQDPAGDADMDAQMKAMMEKMQQVATPGKHHEALARYLGDWDVELAMIMPGGPTQKSTGTAHYDWAIEGKWLTQKIDGTLMGQPYESFAVLGFDNYAKNHLVAVVSSADTSMLVARGVVVDPEGKVTAVYGTLDEYTTDELNKPFKAVTRLVDENHHVTEVWDLGVGADGVKVLEFRFARKK